MQAQNVNLSSVHDTFTIYSFISDKQLKADANSAASDELFVRAIEPSMLIGKILQ